MRLNQSFWPLLLAAVILLMALGALNLVDSRTVQAAAPTPVANINQGDNARLMNWMLTQAITGDTRSCQIAGLHEFADIQYVIDQATATNTLTLTLQYSNDNTNYTSGANLVAGNTADADNLAQWAMFGQYNCIYADVVNTNTVTVTVIGLGK